MSALLGRAAENTCHVAAVTCASCWIADDVGRRVNEPSAPAVRTSSGYGCVQAAVVIQFTDLSGNEFGV
jgi:hypothetical protein